MVLPFVLPIIKHGNRFLTNKKLDTYNIQNGRQLAMINYSIQDFSDMEDPGSELLFSFTSFDP